WSRVSNLSCVSAAGAVPAFVPAGLRAAQGAAFASARHGRIKLCSMQHQPVISPWDRGPGDGFLRRETSRSGNDGPMAAGGPEGLALAGLGPKGNGEKLRQITSLDAYLPRPAIWAG